MYQFTEDCLTGIALIDEEHRRLFQLINEAVSLTSQTGEVSGIAKNLIANLRDYAATHFAHEEAYMLKIGDPELARQQKEHAAFTKKIHSFSLDASSEEQMKTDLNELLTYLIRWLYRHILSSDILIGKMETTAASAKDPFAFTDNYKTGIELIDEEHRRLFEIIRETNDLLHEELLHDKYDEIIRLLTELRNYTEFHFQDEETYMEQIGYPGLAAQKRAHTAFVERLVEIDLSDLDNMDDNQQEYLLELIDFLLGWLSNHILGTDKKIGTYAAGRGLLPQN